jgi:hypothetical protein
MAAIASWLMRSGRRGWEVEEEGVGMEVQVRVVVAGAV